MSVIKPESRCAHLELRQKHDAMSHTMGDRVYTEMAEESISGLEAAKNMKNLQ